MRRSTVVVAMCVMAVLGSAAGQDRLRTNGAGAARILPPQGIAISGDDKAKLEDALEHFDQHRAAIMAQLREQGRLKQRDADLADALIFEKAVRYALDLGEFYKSQDVAKALELLKLGEQRLEEATRPDRGSGNLRGLVVRGYRSRLDGSVQPYGLVIPERLDFDKASPLFVWLHGRNEKGTDLHFIAERMRSKGEFVPDDAIVLHPFGRYCNAFKFAGETDVFEAIDSVKSRYKIDESRVVLMGFSMGGAGVWHLGAHYPDRWIAMSPGAGFVDTRKFQRLSGARLPPWYEQTLWGLYDVPAATRSLFNLPVVSYSGEIDGQKASADIMEEEYASHGRKLQRVIGAKMPHRYDQASKDVILARMREELARQRESPAREVFWQSPTLRYNRAHWIEVLGLAQHWQDSRIDARRERGSDGTWQAHLNTANVSAFRCVAEKTGGTLADIASAFTIDGQQVETPPSSGHWRKIDGKWQAVAADANAVLRKRHGLQGPIDDAFVEPFLFVRPTGKSPNAAVQTWAEAEMAHQIRRWKELFRGDVRVKDDKDVTADDRRRFHLVLWGDRASNRLLAEIADKLPLRWTAEAIEIVGSQDKHPAQSAVVSMIYPNPLNLAKYVVLNSGPTFREADDRSNALQTPKLPDWAVIDIATPPDGKRPGRIVEAGFFDEEWRYRQREREQEAAGQ